MTLDAKSILIGIIIGIILCLLYSNRVYTDIDIPIIVDTLSEKREAIIQSRDSVRLDIDKLILKLDSLYEIK